MNNSIYKRGLVVVLIIALIIMTIVGVKLSSKEKDMTFSNLNHPSDNDINEINTNTENEATIEVSNIIMVDIDGAVINPGVYEFVEGDRVNDAIIKAGGLTDKAYTKNINKARKLMDGEKIYIAEEGEDIEAPILIDALVLNQKININTASKELLMTLNGIGEIYSQRIIEYRDKTRFTTIEEIKNINGIGEKTYENIKEFITTD